MQLGWAVALAIGAVSVPPSVVYPQGPRCQRAAFKLTRYDEDYRFLRDAACRSSVTDPVKYVDLGDSARYVSLGATMRQRYERVHNVDWGRGHVDRDGYLLQRYMLHADVHVDRWRAFVDVASDHVVGRTGGARPTDADALDVHQAFVEVAVRSARNLTHALRVGRQEIAFGSERLVSVRDGPNVRLSFDGVRAITSIGGWRTDAFLVILVQTNKGTFDNRADRAQRFWGIHSTKSVASSRFALDLYYLGLEKARARFEQGTERERRHSIGARGWGKIGGFDYDVELVEQRGAFGSATIRGWTIASNVGYTADGRRWKPRFGLKADITSGDDNPADSRLETFNPLFPRGGYFGVASLIGPQNHMDLHPSVDIHITKGFTLSGDWDFFWRQSLADGQYAVAGALQVPGQASLERYVGSQASATAAVRINQQLGVTGNYGHFFTGPFLRQATARPGVDYFALWLDYRL